MKETIAQYANFASNAAMVVLFCTLTIEKIAQDNALAAAFWSPFAVVSVVWSAFYLSRYFGWIAT